MNRNITGNAMLAAQNRGMDMTKVRPHTLILAAKLDSSESSYRLDLRQSEQEKILPGVVRGLLDRDGYIAAGMALGFAKVPVIAGKEYPTAAQIVFHPDPNVFPEPSGAGHALGVAQALRSVHLGTHTLKTNEGIRIDKNPNFPFMTIQQTQGSGTTENMLTGLEVKDLGADVRFAGGDENEVIIHTKCDDKTLIGGTDAYNVYVLAFLIGAISKGATTKTYTR